MYPASFLIVICKICKIGDGWLSFRQMRSVASRDRFGAHAECVRMFAGILLTFRRGQMLIKK